MLEQVFPGDSEMARRCRAFDWAATPLGMPAGWPEGLKHAVRMVLSSRFPMFIWWGERELVNLYNDGYAPVLGARHPAALGQSASAVWSEIWDTVGAQANVVFTDARATWDEELPLVLERNGYREEGYFTYSYSPIPDGRGGVGGLLCACTEDTQRVLSRRRLKTLRDVVAGTSQPANSAEQACLTAAHIVADNPRDLPFVLIYLMDADGATARLAGATGILAGSSAAPRVVELTESSEREDTGWPLGRVLRSAQAEVIEAIHQRFARVPSGASDEPPTDAVVVPMSKPGQTMPTGFLVAGVSPLRPLDDDYRGFLDLLAEHIATAVANARAYEETERRAEALAELDRAKTTFFSNVSHEFRTPLTLILSPIADLLSRAQTDLSPAVADALDIVNRNGLRLLRLVNTLLDFSRIEAGRTQATYQPTELAAFTAELASNFRSACERAGLELVVDCEPLPEAVYVDRDMWEKIVLNLVSNAFKFTSAGSIRVAMHARNERAVLEVIDTGTGVPTNEIPRLFERFHRVENAGGRTHEGSGIGLALVQELVRLHGGSVTVTSELARGSTFTVAVPLGTAHLPAAQVGAEPTAPFAATGATPFVAEALRWLPELDQANDIATNELPPDHAPSPHVGFAIEADPRDARPQVLVVDDNADMRQYIARLLSEHYDVAVAADGEAALAAVRNRTPDLVLSDVMMPKLDGFGLIRALRADERTRTLPVILLSARAGEESRVNGLHAGADGYLVKPFSARELVACVAAHLQIARVRREAEQALRHRSEQFETLVNRAPLGIYLIDADFRIRDVNPVAGPVFAGVPGGAAGRDFAEVMHLLWSEAFANEIVARCRHVLASGEPWITSERAEFRIDLGVTEYYEWRVDRIALADGRDGLISYFRDVSGQVAARRAIEESREALKEADRRKDEFLATLAHELRNPLAPIRNSIGILRLAGARIDAHRIYETIERQVEHMVRLVDDLMEISRITRGKIELRKQSVELAVVVTSAIETSRPLIEAGRHELTVTLPDERLYLDADPVRLTQVLANVLNNAAKYTDDSGHIWLDAKREGSSVVVRVRDTGVGIAADALPKVFDLFMQVERTHNRAQGGLGIGLTLVRTLVEMHGGTVEVRSEGSGRGSEFILRLPLIDDKAVGAHKTNRDASPTIAQRRVLVVDDNRDAAETLAMLLKFLGADVRTARDGQAALDEFSTYRPSVVLLDIGMPGMDGFEVARRIRALPTGKDATLIALTGWGQEEDRRHSRSAGIDHHMIKPVDVGALEVLLSTLGPVAMADQPTPIESP